jgi:glutamate--cysteine ligase
LTDFIASGERSRDTWSVGTEYEKHVVDALGAPLPYEAPGGAPSISGLLTLLCERRGWAPIMEGEHIIGGLKAGASITLEPGGQIELSGAPMASLTEMSHELDGHVEDLRFLSDALGVHWLWAGAHPLAELKDIPWMPKARYAIMRRYLPTRGDLALHMMKTTATVQANLDFADEDDMGRKLRASMGLSSLVAGLFANSPVGIEGLAPHPTPCVQRSWRWDVWRDTDPDRCGLPPWVFEGQPTYEQWVDYALDVPMFLLIKEGEIIDMAGRSFRRYAKEGFGDHQPTLEDWNLHLSTLFPDVRLKTYMEMRSADCVPPHLIVALPALWVGLLYDASALDAAWELVRSWTFTERLEHRAASCELALHAPVPGKTYTSVELARELVAIAKGALGPEDAALLEPLEAIAQSGQTLADKTIAWAGKAPRTRSQIVDHYRSS